MNNEYLINKFSTGTTWNGIFYLVHRILATLVTMLFFKQLPTAVFSVWINSISIIFLTALWLDCGLRKTIPYYAASYTRTKQTQQWFTITTIKYYSLLLLGVVPLWYILINPLLAPYTPLAALLLIAESMVSLLRLIFHSHFWHKQFNSMHAAALVITTIFQMSTLLLLGPHNPHLITALLSIQIIGSIIMVCVALAILSILSKKQWHTAENTQEDVPIQRKTAAREVVAHAGVMWSTTISKSITERNMLVPLFTTIFGPHHANIFKVGQDGALLLQRIVIKTIGTTDTSLLAHAYTKGEQRFVHDVFEKITTKIAALCLPLSGIVLSMLIKKEWFFNDPLVFHIFYIMVTCYLIESTLAIYERILEVKRAYKLLFIAYIPYILILGASLFFNIFSSIGLIGSIFVIQGVRLVSLLCMTYSACRVYSAPLSRITCITIVGIVIPLVCYYILITF